MTAVWKKVDFIFGKILGFISMSCLAALFFLLIANVCIRFFIPSYSLSWYDEVVELAFAYMVFFGAAALQRAKQHFIVDVFVEKIKDKLSGCIIAIAAHLITLVFYVTLLYYGMDLTSRAADVSPILHLSRKLFYMCIPASAFFLVIYTVRDLMENITKTYKLVR